MFETADSVSCRWENVISFCCKVLLRIVNICNSEYVCKFDLYVNQQCYFHRLPQEVVCIEHTV